MKKYLILLLSLISFSAFAQPGSQKISGLFVRVLDSAAYQTAAASSHTASPEGYADIYWNAQATTPHFDIWNGSGYTHVFDFNAGGSGSTPTLQQVITAGSVLTGNNEITGPRNTSIQLGDETTGGIHGIEAMSDQVVLKSDTFYIQDIAGGNTIYSDNGIDESGIVRGGDQIVLNGTTGITLTTDNTDGIKVSGGGTLAQTSGLLTKAQVGDYITSRQFKKSVKASSTANIDLNNAGASMDGITLAAQDRVLLKDQSTGSQNGIYNVVSLTPTVLTRVGDFSSSTFEGVLTNSLVLVDQGTTNGGKAYRLSTTGAITIGTTALTFTEFGAGGGTGWATSGNTNVTTPTITGIPTFIGNALIQTDALGVTQVTNSGLALTNETDAIVSLNQYSPAFRFKGSGWKTNATAAAQDVEYRVDVETATGAISPGGRLRFMKSVNGATFSHAMYLDTDDFDPTGGGLTVESQTGANGADINTYMNDPTPTAADRISETHAYGNDSGGNKTQYTAIYSEIVDPTDGSEDGRQLMNITANGGLFVTYLSEPSGSFGVTTLNSMAKFNRNGYEVSLGENIATANTGFRYAKTTSGRLPFVFANTTTAVGSYAEINITNDLAGTFSEGLRGIKFTDNWVSLGGYKTDGAAIEAGSGLVGGLSLIAANTTSGEIRFYTDGTADANLYGLFSNAGNFNVRNKQYIGDVTTTPTAKIHIAAGTATAATAPLKIDDGTNLTTPEDGAIEHSSDNLNFTAGTTRYTLAKTLTATAALNFDLTSVNSEDLTITVTGAADGDAVSVGVPNASATANVIFTWWTSGANTVTVRASRIDVATGADPASGTFRASVIKY